MDIPVLGDFLNLSVEEKLEFIRNNEEIDADPEVKKAIAEFVIPKQYVQAGWVLANTDLDKNRSRSVLNSLGVKISHHTLNYEIFFCLANERCRKHRTQVRLAAKSASNPFRHLKKSHNKYSARSLMELTNLRKKRKIEHTQHSSKVDDDNENSFFIQSMQTQTKSFPKSGVIHLNVGGVNYSTTVTTLISKSGYFSALQKSNISLPSVHNDAEELEYYFIDRNGELFKHVLSFLRDSEVDQSISKSCCLQLKKEAEYFSISSLPDYLDKMLTRRKYKAVKSILFDPSCEIKIPCDSNLERFQEFKESYWFCPRGIKIHQDHGNCENDERCYQSGIPEWKTKFCGKSYLVYSTLVNE